MRSSVLSLLAITLVGATTLVGCKGNSVEGSWKVSGAQMGPFSDVKSEFKGGNFTVKMSGNMPPVGPLGVDVTGTYTQTGEQMTLTANDVKLDSSKASPQAQMLLNSPQANAQMKQQLGKPQSGKIKWDSSDQFSITDEKGNAVTYTRIK